MKYFLNDPRYRALDERDKEEIFQDYLDDLEKKEREDFQIQTKQRISNLRNFFEEQKLSADTTWEQCQEKFGKLPLFHSADDLERLS